MKWSDPLLQHADFESRLQKHPPKPPLQNNFHYQTIPQLPNWFNSKIYKPSHPQVNSLNLGETQSPFSRQSPLCCSEGKGWGCWHVQTNDPSRGMVATMAWTNCLALLSQHELPIRGMMGWGSYTPGPFYLLTLIGLMILMFGVLPVGWNNNWGNICIVFIERAMLSVNEAGQVC